MHFDCGKQVRVLNKKGATSGRQSEMQVHLLIYKGVIPGCWSEMQVVGTHYDPVT